MYYLIAFQVLCGCFSAFVAGRKGRSRLAWWLMGALLPVFGVLLSLAAPAAPGAPRSAAAATDTKREPSQTRKRPKRCCGSYIPDCFGCPFFRRQLFDSDRSEDKKGYCEFFGRELRDKSKRKGSTVVIEDS